MQMSESWLLFAAISACVAALAAIFAEHAVVGIIF